MGETLRRHDLRPRKALGQNFLLDLSLTRRIARAGAAPLGEVVEIGPGPGGLTRALLMEGAERVVAIEKDESCLAALSEIAAHYPGRLHVVEGDALTVDPRPHLRSGAPQIIANLPYNVGTELVVRWLKAGQLSEGRAAPEDGAPWWRRITVMLQKEVAERAAAEAGGKTYGRLAVLCAWRGEARLLFDVAPRAFTPPPKVTSSVLSITPSAAPRFPAPLGALERVTAAAFSQRRKMLRSALKSLGDPAALIDAAGLDPTVRPETLRPEAFGRLAEALARRER
ncbi:MAG: 16S rRNA (adenine(1518)-N(6)/adenine(1519)-N(6))-dimethyltransferase RsmA [Pseudomonadota bacterium]